LRANRRENKNRERKRGRGVGFVSAKLMYLVGLDKERKYCKNHTLELRKKDAIDQECIETPAMTYEYAGLSKRRGNIRKASEQDCVGVQRSRE
jgi:hypothetical protein